MIGGAIAKLRAVIGLDDKEFRAGTKRVSGQAKALQSTLASMSGAIKAAFGIGAIVAFGRAAFNALAEVDTVAKNLNTTVGEIAGLKAIADKTGLSFQQLQTVLAKVSGIQSEAAKGSERYEAALEGLGINAREFVTASPGDALKMIADAANESATPLTALGDLFGEKLGARTLNMLRTLSKDGIGSISGELETAIGKAAELDDRMKQILSEAKMNAGSGFVKAFDFIERNITGTMMGVDSLLRGEGISAAVQAGMKGRASDPLNQSGMVTRTELYGGKSLAEEAAEEMGRVYDATQEARDKAARDEANAKIDREVESKNREIEGIKKEMDRAEIQGDGRMSGFSGRGVGSDQLAQVGGAVGGYRPDIAVADRQLKVSMEELRIAKEMLRLTEEIAARQNEIASINAGRPQ